MTIKPHHILLILILLAGAAIRIYGAATIPFNLDERWHIYPAAMAGTVLEAIQYNAKFDGHPILTPVWLYSLLQVNDSLLWLRLPSVLAGIGLIAVCYRLGRHISGRHFGLAFAGLVAFAYMPMVQSQLVRGYSVMLLCTAIAYYAALKYDRENKWLWLYTLVMCVSVSMIISSIAFAAAVGTVYFFKWIYTQRILCVGTSKCEVRSVHQEMERSISSLEMKRIYERKSLQKLVYWCAAHALILIVFSANYWLTNVYGGASGLMWTGQDFMLTASPLVSIANEFIRYVISNSIGLVFYSALETQLYLGVSIIILCILVPVFLVHSIQMRLHVAIWAVCISYIALMEHIIPNSSSMLRRSSFILVPCFIVIIFSIKFLLQAASVKLYFLKNLFSILIITIGCMLGNLYAHQFYWKYDADEFYLMTEENAYYFQNIEANDLLITDGMSAFELLYPSRAELVQKTPFVRSVEGYPYPVYTFGYDSRELQSVMTLHTWQNYLRNLDAIGAFEGKEIIWVWRKTPPWTTEIQAELLCDLPQKNLFKNLKDPIALSKAEADLKLVQQLVRTEAARHTKPIFLKRALNTDCNHSFYGISVEFIRNELLNLSLYQYDQDIITQMRNSGAWNSERRARHLERFFERLHKGGSNDTLPWVK